MSWGCDVATYVAASERKRIMVRKGLNIGDTFSDDGRLFRVTQVLGSGDYISEAVTENPVDPDNRNDSRAVADPDNAEDSKKETVPGLDDSSGGFGKGETVDDPDIAGNQDDSEKETAPDSDDSLGNQKNNGTADDGSLGDLNAGRYTRRQIQRMSKADTIALAGELGIEISAKTAEIKEVILRNLGL